MTRLGGLYEEGGGWWVWEEGGGDGKEGSGLVGNLFRGGVFFFFGVDGFLHSAANHGFSLGDYIRGEEGVCVSVCACVFIRGGRCFFSV